MTREVLTSPPRVRPGVDLEASGVTASGHARRDRGGPPPHEREGRHASHVRRSPMTPSTNSVMAKSSSR